MLAKAEALPLIARVMGICFTSSGTENSVLFVHNTTIGKIKRTAQQLNCFLSFIDLALETG